MEGCMGWNIDSGFVPVVRVTFPLPLMAPVAITKHPSIDSVALGSLEW